MSRKAGKKAHGLCPEAAFTWALGSQPQEPTPDAGLSPSTVLAQGLLSQTSEQDPICPRLTLTLRGTVGGREARLEMLAGTVVLKPAFLPGAQTFKGQDVLRLVPAAAHGPAGASPGVSAQSCQGSWHLLCLGAKERPLMRSLCELQEPGPSHCWTAEKGWGHISPQLGTLLAHQDILKQAGEGVPASPLWQPFLFKGYLPQVLPNYRMGERREGGACGDQSWENCPPPSLPLWVGRGPAQHRQATHSQPPRLQDCC